MTADDRIRCAWIDESRLSPDDFVLYRDYHDTEWGRPLRDSTALFERVTLEAFQSGLSWLIILRKRENFRRAFHQFDVERVARYRDRDVTRLMGDAGIVRNRAKIEAARRNAAATLLLREEEGLQAFIDGFRPDTDPAPRVADEVPTTSPESVALSKALRKRGFAFVGPTTMHALMEALGLVDTHLVDCHRRGVARS